MSKLFLSHSSHDNAAAVALCDWMQREGFGDVFLDTDPKRGIAAGERWERALHEAASRCEAVLFLVSRAWLASGWCLKEFNLAHRLNKRLFGVLIEDIPVAELPVNLTDTWQLVNLASGRDHLILTVSLPVTHEETHVTFSAEGLTRLRMGLRRAGLDPSMFVWPPAGDLKRTPYPGLRPLEAEDAGIYFGREAQIIEALDRLRALRTAAAPRLLCILGSSGSGKSSFLRAGLWPRLARDDEHFLPLPVLRPERNALTGKTGLLSILEEAANAGRLRLTRAALRQAIKEGAAPLRPVLTQIRDAAAHLAAEPEGGDKAEPPLLVLPIDQGEELFLGDGAQEGSALLALLRDLALEDAPALAVVLTIRSDAFERLQLAPALEGITLQTMTFGPMPRGIYSTIIEGPATRMREADRPLVIEPALTRALLDDLEVGGGRDALPLLAFTLERMWREYGGSGRLALVDYEQLGRVRGSIEAGVQEVLRQADTDPRLPRDRGAQLALLRRGLIPWLAGIDPDTGSPRRRVARRSEIPAEAAPLVDLLVEARLLSTDTDATGEVTVEPAHEALLRQWGLLQGWLEEDFAALTALDGIGRAAREWEANARGEAWLAHGGERLAEAERLLGRPDLAAQLNANARDYLTGCKRRVEQELTKERQRARQRRWLQGGASAAALIFAALSVLALWQNREASASRQEAITQKEEAQRQSLLALAEKSEAVRQASIANIQELSAKSNQSAALSALSLSNLLRSPARATKLALSAWPRSEHDLSPRLKSTLNALGKAVPQLRELKSIRGNANPPDIITFSRDGKRILTSSPDNIIRVFDAESTACIATFIGHSDTIRSAIFLSDSKRILSSSDDQSAKLWDIETGVLLANLEGHKGSVRQAVFSPDETSIMTIASDDDRIRIWDSKNGQLLKTVDKFLIGNEEIRGYAGFSPDSRLLVASQEDNTAIILNTINYDIVAKLHGHDNWLTDIAISLDSTRIVTSSLDKTARLWDAKNGRLISVLHGHSGTLERAVFSPDSSRVFTIASGDNTVRLWNGKTGQLIEVFQRLPTDDENINSSVVFSPSGKLIAVISEGDLVNIRNSEDGKIVGVLRGHTASITSVKFSPNLDLILTTSADNTARVWIATNGKDLAILDSSSGRINDAYFAPDGYHILVTTLSGESAEMWDGLTGKSIASFRGYKGSLRIALFSPDGRKLLTAASQDNLVRIWDAKLGQSSTILAGHRAQVLSAAFSPDGRRTLTSSQDGTARLWNNLTGKNLVTMNVSSTRGVRSALFSPAGDVVITIPEQGSIEYVPPIPKDNTATIWDATTGQVRAVLRGHEAGINSVKFSPNSERIMTTSLDGTARIWGAANGQLLNVIQDHRRNLSDAFFSPNGDLIFTFEAGSSAAAILDAKTGESRIEFKGLEGGVNRAVFSPDSSRILIIESGGGAARIWDATTAQPIIELKGLAESASIPLFSPDGSRIFITESGKSAAGIWDATTGRPIIELKGLDESVNSAVFSPDGSRILITESGKSAARIWDATTGQPIIELKGHKSGINSAVFSLDGNYVVTASSDMMARIWSVRSFPSGDIVKVACALLPDTDLSELRDDFDLSTLEPICVNK